MAEDKYINGDAAQKFRDARGGGVANDGYRFGVYSVELETTLGAPTDAAASGDTGTFNLTQAIKRLLSVKLPNTINGRVPTANPATFGNPTLAASSALGAGLSFDVSAFSRVRLQINNGANALNGFEISTEAHATGDFQIHLNTTTHFVAPSSSSILRHCGDLNGAAIDPTTLAANGRVVMAFDLRDFFASDLRIRASSASGSTIQFYWGAA